MKRDLLTILDLSAEEIRRLIDRARAMKAEWAAGSLLPTCRTELADALPKRQAACTW